MKFCIKDDIVLSELIDTLWNVNVGLMTRFGMDVVRINRYIMECKCFFRQWGHTLAFELIDTLWNVNIDGLVITYDDVEN